jgi:hypothetical protein
VSERPVRLVLDTSAILSYAKAETLHVGETITQVEENGAAFGVPIACLAMAGGADATLLHMLTTHPACELLTVEVEEWRQWAAMTDVLGRLDAAAALVAASYFDCDVLTCDLGLYRVLGDDPPIVAFEA